jgi:NTE family protein
MRYALILGGGGTVGVSWTIGALHSFADTLGIDLNDAVVMVGTSAGSVVAALIRTGHPLADAVAEEREPPRSSGGGWATSFDPLLMVEIFQLWVLGGPMTVETAQQMGERALRASRKTGDEWVAIFLERLGNLPWPERDLRLATTVCRTGERRILTGADDVDLVRAVAASCAVPGIVPPVEINGEPFMDGGVWSLANADAVVGTGVTEALLVGPLASGGFLARAATASLERDRTLLEGKGIRVHTLVPGPGYEPLGANSMDPAFCAQAVELGLVDGVGWAKRVADAGFLAQ